MKDTIGGVTIVYIGNYFEWSGSLDTMKKYYYAGSVRVGNTTGEAGLTYILGDHLGSGSVFVNPDGSPLGGLTYKPWGELHRDRVFLLTSGNTIRKLRLPAGRITPQPPPSSPEDELKNQAPAWFGEAGALINE